MWQRWLSLAVAFYLAVPAGWCCLAPELSFAGCSALVAAAEPTCCCCRDTEPADPPRPTPHDPDKICCQRADLSPAPTGEGVSMEPGLTAGWIDPPSLSHAVFAHGVAAPVSPIVSPPLHLLHCLWLC